MARRKKTIVDEGPWLFSEEEMAGKICSRELSFATRNTLNNNGQSTVASSFMSNKLELPKLTTTKQSQIIQHVGYTTSYNTNWLIPNWVVYDLTKKEVHGAFKSPKKLFEPDPQVKGRSAQHSDYTNSGYSRGHMAPAADMKWSEQAMLESFYLSNVCPQLAELNAGVWEHLEKRCRALAD